MTQRWRQKGEEFHAKMETEFGVMCLPLRNTKACWHHQKLGQMHGTGFPSEPPEGINAVDTPILDFQSAEL